MNESKHAYSDLKKMGIKNEDARFVLPNAVESIIAVSANLREWRHIIEVRGSADAQWEIREVIIEILRILTKYAPTVFEDFTIDEAKKLVVKKTK
jgi:thymidylate synthase (FAD)